MAEVKTDNKNSMIQQLVTNSNLTGQALESYKAELEKLSETQLQAKLSESLNGNKASTDTQVEGLALEHNSDAVEEDKKDNDATTSTDADGNEVAETKENGQTIKKVITSKDKKTVTSIEYKDGKPTKKTVKKDGNTVESTTYKYTEKDGSEQVKITATGADKSKTVTTASGVDESGNVPDGKYISQTKTTMSGVKTTANIENGYLKPLEDFGVIKKTYQNGQLVNTQVSDSGDNSESQNVTEKTVGNKVIQYKDGVVSRSVESGSDGMIAREYKRYNVDGVEYTGVLTSRIANGQTENNVVLVKNIDGDGNYSDNDIVSNTLYDENNKVSKEIYYTNGKVSSTKTYGADETPTSQSKYEYIPTGVVRTTTDENGTVRVIADSVDSSGNLNGIKERITRHTDGSGVAVLAKGNNKQDVITLSKVNEDFTYNNSDITNKRETTAFLDYTDDDVPEEEKSTIALQKVIDYMSTNNHVGKLTYDKSAIRNMFSSLGKEGSDYVRDDKNSTSGYTRYVRKGDNEGEIYVRSSREIKYGLKSVDDNSSEFLIAKNSGNGIRKLYHFNPDGSFNGVEIINDKKDSHKSVIMYDNGSSDVMEYKDGHEKKKLHYNTKGQFEYARVMNWKDGNTLDSTVYTYSDHVSDTKLKNTQVIETPQGDRYIYNLDGDLQKRVMRNSVPILNKNNEIVGYAPISEMDVDANGRVTNIPHASIKYLNGNTLNAGEHYDYSQIDNDLRDTALSQLEQGYQAAIDVLENRKENDSVLNASYLLNEGAEWFGGGTDGYIKHLKQKKAEVEQMKSRFVHGVQRDKSGNITDASIQTLRKSHGQDSSAFAAEYKKLTGKDWNNEERQKYLKFNLDTQKVQLDLQRVYDEYKKNGKLSTSAQATFNVLTDGQYMDGDSKKMLKQFIKEVDSTKQKDGTVNTMASAVGAFAYGKLLEKNKDNLGNAQTDMNIAVNNDKNLRDTGAVLDILGCVIEFGLVAKGIQYVGKGIKAVSALANVGKVAKYTARAGEFLSSELRSAKVINSALHAGKDALNMAATMGTFDAASVLGNQVVTGKYDLGQVGKTGLHGAATGAIGGALMHYITPQIMKMYKPESQEFEKAVDKVAEKAQKAGKTLTGSDIMKATSRVQMPQPTSIRGIATILADLTANSLVFTGGSAVVNAFDDSEIREMLKNSGAYTDAEIKGMSKKDLMRESLKMQGVDTNNMSDYDITTQYFSNELENQFKGLAQMKIAEYVAAGITKHLQGGALKLGKRASKLEYEYKEGNWYKKGDKSKTPVPTEYMSAEVKQAMAYDALEARLNNRFNKYSKAPMNGRELMGMIYDRQLPEGLETQVAEGLTINIKGGKYEITDANGKTKTVDNIEGIIDTYQNDLVETYRDNIRQKVWDQFEQNNGALDKISKDANPKTVHIKTEGKYNELKTDLTDKLANAKTDVDFAALQSQVDVIQNRDMRREFSHMIDARRAEINPKFDITDLASVQKAEPQKLFAPKTATNIANQGISFKQAPNQSNYTATRIEWGKTVEETIALNKKNGINLELVKDKDGSYYFGIKNIRTDGYYRVDRNAVVMHYGDYNPSETSVNAKWAKAHANSDGKIQDCAVVANDEGARILENSYVTADGQKIDFATMKPGTAVHKNPNAVVNAVAYDKPQTVHTLEGDITTDVTMGDVEGNAYSNFKQLKKQILNGQLVANDADVNSAKFIQLVKDGKDAEALTLLKQATAKSAQGTANVKPETTLGAVATSADLMASDKAKPLAETLGTVEKDGKRIYSKDDFNKLKANDKNVKQMPNGTVITLDAKSRTVELGKLADTKPADKSAKTKETKVDKKHAEEKRTDLGPIKPSKKDPFGMRGVISDEYLNQTKGTLLVKKGDNYVLSPEADKVVFDAARQIEKVAQKAEQSIVDYMINGGFATKETLSHRCKSAQSLHDKIQNALIDDKSGTLTLEKAINKVKDSVGVRTVNPISNIANDPRVQAFVKAGDMKSARMMAVEIESDYVLKALMNYVDLKAEGKTDMELTRISNYIGEDGIPYFTEKQLHQLKVYADKKGVNMPVVERVARPSETDSAKTGETYNDGSTTKVRESGYTALQMNFRTKDGLTYEWQYRGEALNKFAEGEHVPYDLRTNKDIIGVHTELTRLYEPMKELLTNKEKMSDEQYKEYNNYLTAHYEYLRLHELGFNDGKNPPKLPKGFDARLRAENLELLHETAEKIKKEPEKEEQYRKEYEANLVQNTPDNVTTESYTKAAEARRANKTVDQYEATARLDMNENENDVNDIIEHCKSNDGQIRDNLVSEASTLGYMGVKPKDVIKLLDMMKSENIDSVSKDIQNLKAKKNSADINTIVSDYINSNGKKSDMSLSDRLNQANSKEEFNAIRDEIKKMPEGNEKQTAFITYLKKYNQWSQSPNSPKLFADVAKDPNVTMPDENIAQQITNSKDIDTLNALKKEIGNMPAGDKKSSMMYEWDKKYVSLFSGKDENRLMQIIDNAKDTETLNSIESEINEKYGTWDSPLWDMLCTKRTQLKRETLQNIPRFDKNGNRTSLSNDDVDKVSYYYNNYPEETISLLNEKYKNADGKEVSRFDSQDISMLVSAMHKYKNEFTTLLNEKMADGSTPRFNKDDICDMASEMAKYKTEYETLLSAKAEDGKTPRFSSDDLFYLAPLMSKHKTEVDALLKMKKINADDNQVMLSEEEIEKYLPKIADETTANKITQLLQVKRRNENGETVPLTQDEVIELSGNGDSLDGAIQLLQETRIDNNGKQIPVSAKEAKELSNIMQRLPDAVRKLLQETRLDKNGNTVKLSSTDIRTLGARMNSFPDEVHRLLHETIKNKDGVDVSRFEPNQIGWIASALHKYKSETEVLLNAKMTDGKTPRFSGDDGISDLVYIMAKHKDEFNILLNAKTADGKKYRFSADDIFDLATEIDKNNISVLLDAKTTDGKDRFNVNDIATLIPVLKDYPAEVKLLLDEKMPNGKEKFFSESISKLAPLIKDINVFKDLLNAKRTLPNGKEVTQFTTKDLQILAPNATKENQENLRTIISEKVQNGSIRFHVNDIPKLLETMKQYPEEVKSLWNETKLSKFGYQQKLSASDISALAPTFKTNPNEVKSLLQESRLHANGKKEPMSAKEVSELAPLLKQYPEEIKSLWNETIQAFNGVLYSRFNGSEIAKLITLMHDSPENHGIVNELLNEKYIDGGNPRFSQQDISILTPLMKQYPEYVRELINEKGAKGYARFSGEDIAKLTSLMKDFPDNVRYYKKGEKVNSKGYYDLLTADEIISNVIREELSFPRTDSKPKDAMNPTTSQEYYTSMDSSPVKFSIENTDGKTVTQEVKTADDVRAYLKSFTKSLNDNYIEDIVKLFETNPKSFNKIANSGLFNLIDRGYINDQKINQLFSKIGWINENTTFSHRMLSEIKSVKEQLDAGIEHPSLVKTLPKNADNNWIAQNIRVGDVYEQNGQLYVRENGNIYTPLKLSKTNFDKCFPMLSSSFNQGQIGDCWLVSALDNMMDKPQSRAEIFKMFSENGNDIYVKIPTGKKPLKFQNGEVIDVQGNQLRGANGIQMLERAYAIHRNDKCESKYDIENTDVIDMSTLTDQNALQNRLDGGWSVNAWEQMMGRAGTQINSPTDIEKIITTSGNNTNWMVGISFYQPKKVEGQREGEIDDKLHLFGNHAYAIKAYKPSTGMVYMTNPWNTSTIIKLPLKLVMNNVKKLDVIPLKL